LPIPQAALFGHPVKLGQTTEMQPGATQVHTLIEPISFGTDNVHQATSSRVAESAQKL
jgi:hypothetical protein